MHRLRGVAILTVSAELIADEPATTLVEARIRTLGERVAARTWVPPSEPELRAQVIRWIASPAIDAVIVCGESHAHVAAEAVRPLVTEVEAEGVWCASTRVFVMPESPTALVEALERVVRALPPQAPVPTGSAERMTTDKIAVIGDLPSIPISSPSLDLRAGGRRGLWAFAVVCIAGVAAMAALAGNVAGRETPTVAQDDQSDATPSVPLVRAASVKAPVEALAPPPAKVATRAPGHTPSHAPARPAEHPRTHAAPPPAPVRVPVELEAPAVQDDDTCTQESCARHGNERECCTPFRPHAGRLDRAQIASTTSPIRAQVQDCRDPQSSDGVVRVSIEVAPDGSVTKAMVLESPEVGVGRCVAELVRGLMFPVTDEGGTFVYRAELKPD